MDTETGTVRYFPSLKDIVSAKQVLNEVIATTPLTPNRNLSERFNCDIWLKREDLQQVRSYKIRGAYNKIRSLSKEECDRGVVCASAGNHAQGVAYSCHKLKIKGKIFMPKTTPKQKIESVRMWGGEYVEIVLVGDTFDAASDAAKRACSEENMVFIPPFDEPKIIEGQATVALEILQQTAGAIDYVFVPIGGGGLAAGVGSYFSQISPGTKVIGVEPVGAACMKASIDNGGVIKLPEINKFVDGAAVQKAGDYTYEICKVVLDDIITVPEGEVCTTILNLYNRDAIVVEPAGALSIAALNHYKDKLAGKTVVCIVSGSNNDITRMEEIKERSLLFEGLRHYFIINMPQRSGSMAMFINEILSPNEDIIFFEYKKKINRESGPAMLGIEIQKPEDLSSLIERMKAHNLEFEYLNDKPTMFEYLVF